MGVERFTRRPDYGPFLSTAEEIHFLSAVPVMHLGGNQTVYGYCGNVTTMSIRKDR